MRLSSSLLGSASFWLTSCVGFSVLTAPERQLQLAALSSFASLSHLTFSENDFCIRLGSLPSYLPRLHASIPLSFVFTETGALPDDAILHNTPGTPECAPFEAAVLALGLERQVTVQVRLAYLAWVCVDEEMREERRRGWEEVFPRLVGAGMLEMVQE